MLYNWLSLSALAALTASLASAQQIPFGLSAVTSHLQQQLAPESVHGQVDTEGFSVLAHPGFKHHSVRIRNTTGWCDPSVRSYSGYLDIQDRHLFFYFFESRSKPDEDPLMLWTNGGPGCSSSMGAFMELGACTITGKNSTEPNPYSWTETANVIFIDQPAGVGYSYATHGASVDNTDDAAADIYAFLTIFLEQFESLKGRDFHLAGESYGGRYIPVFASEIVYQNKKRATIATDSSPPIINLKSILVGNGLTDVVSMTSSYYDQACTTKSGLGRPVLDVKACIKMQQAVRKCDMMLEKACRTDLRQPDCDIAASWCSEAFEMPFLEGQINPYDISKPCRTLAEDLCYPETSVISEYLDQPWVRETLGVADRVGPFKSCSPKVAKAFRATNDELFPTFYHLTGLLENDVAILIYVGTLDWICNFIGNYRLVEQLEWSGQDAFKAQHLRKWLGPDGKQAGETKTAGKLTWATIEHAGHMVPRDQPAASSQMVKRWLANDSL